MRTTRAQGLVDLLVRTGMSRNVARTLVILASRSETTSVEIEKSAEMRQPEVSVSVRTLRERGWVTKRDVKKEGKGRPLHAYRLAMPFEKIVAEVVAEAKRRIASLEGDLRELQERAKVF